MFEIDRAVAILRRGGLVAFPTETVYGLGADATNASAVQRIFQAKGRPSNNPLIVHVADAVVARRYAQEWPDEADALAARFWPGPLTLVVTKSDLVVSEATAGGPTVGLRSPDHPLTLDLLRQFDGPVAGPSANRSTQVSPTTAQHVRDELGAAVDMILDGGPCRVGIESTVLDITHRPARILRPGAVTLDQLRGVIGHVELAAVIVSPAAIAMSPGQQAVHYAPRAAAYRFEREQWQAVEAWCRDHAGDACAILTLAFGIERDPADVTTWAGNARGRRIELPASPEGYGRCLYAVLREMDRQEMATIWVELPPDEPQWTAVRDRLRRATKPLRQAGSPHHNG